MHIAVGQVWACMSSSDRSVYGESGYFNNMNLMVFSVHNSLKIGTPVLTDI